MIRLYSLLVDMAKGVDTRLICMFSDSQTVVNVRYTEGTAVTYLYECTHIMSMWSAFIYDPLFFNCIYYIYSVITRSSEILLCAHV